MENQILSPLFIGYIQLESWLNATDKTCPVFAELTQVPGKTADYGYRWDELVIFVAQPDQAHGLIHYCRIVVGELQYMVGDIFTPNAEQRRTLAETAWAIVRAWLEQQGLTVRQGLIAMPDNLRLTDGWAGFLHFDQGEQTYIRKG